MNGRVANALGAQNPSQAKGAACTAVILAALCTSILAVLLLVFRCVYSIRHAHSLCMLDGHGLDVHLCELIFACNGEQQLH